ncbi:MAG: DUF6514 family protein [Eubacteriales bacterium]
MKKIRVCEKNLQDERGKLRNLDYYLLVEEVETEDFFCENYGVAIEEPQGEKAEILGITTKKERAEELLSLLSLHQVSPTTLADVVADWL